MTSWWPHLWKEFRQNRLLGLAALGTFLGFTFIPSLLYSLVSGKEWYGGYSLGTLFLGGPFLALIAGVCAMGREQGNVERFWRAQPVETNRWLVSKYVTGLAIVWLACWASIWIEALTRPVQASYDIASDEMTQSIVYSLILVLIYSVSFVLGLCIRGILHAAILAAGAMALIYLVPMVVAPLSWLSIEAVQKADVGALDASSFVAFAAGMVIPSILLLWLASVLLKRGIQIEIGRRMLSWSVVILLLVFAAGITFPMATNLSPQQVITLPTLKQGGIQKVVADGNNLLVLLSDIPENELGSEHIDSLVSVQIGKEDALVGDPVRLPTVDPDSNTSWRACDIAWSAENPFLVYTLFDEGRRNPRGGRENSYALCVVDLDASEAERITNRIDLTSLFEGRGGTPTMFLYKQQLYVLGARGTKLLVFSLDAPETPALIADETFRWNIGLSGPGMEHYSPEEYVIVEIPPLGLDLYDRLKVTRQFSYYRWWPLGDKQVLACVPDRSSIGMQLVLFEIGSVENNVVVLRPVTRRRIPVLESVLGRSYGQLCCSGSLAFLNSYDNVTVYNLSRPDRIERIGHYAAGEQFSTLLPLPDNRVVMVGKKLYVLDLSKKVE